MFLTLSDLKIPLSGAAFALMAGVLAGSAMQPQLYKGDRPAGPQIFADWAGARSTGPFDPGTTFASYKGKTPDYVLGTDWKHSMAWPQERAAVSPASEAAVDDDAPAPEAATVTRAAYDEPPARLPGYPSLGGARSADQQAVDDDTVDTDPAVSG